MLIAGLSWGSGFRTQAPPDLEQATFVSPLHLGKVALGMDPRAAELLASLRVHEDRLHGKPWFAAALGIETLLCALLLVTLIRERRP